MTPDKNTAAIRLVPTLVLVVPCYNESETLPSTDTQLRRLMAEMKSRGEITPSSGVLYVDDGSRDNTWQMISDYTREDPCIWGIRFARNAGQQNAMLAGMENAVEFADAVITIDADLQDDIRVIPEMVEKYRRGADVVYGVRRDRSSDSWMKRTTALAFYKTINRLGVDSVYNHSEFRLMSARAVRDLEAYGERNLYLRGIVRKVGHLEDFVYYDRLPRTAGETKYSMMKLMNTAADGITSFSIRPVRMVFALGLVFMAIAFGILIYVLVSYFSGWSIAGWTSLMLSVWFCTGVLLISLGIIGEYVGKMYIEVKHRPRFSIEERILP